MASAIELQINGDWVQAMPASVTTTLLDFLRGQHHLPGTKEGCAEGDCGACTVALLDEATGSWRAVNACLMLVGSLHGRRVITVEGLATSDLLHPAQQAMVDHLGSQCGYCTPGVVMSMFEATYRDDLDAPWKLDDQLCGNLCRCTGYRPIRDAAEAVAGTCPDDAFKAVLSEPARPVAPLALHDGDDRFFAPHTLDGIFDALDAHPNARLVAGTTDLGLEITTRHKHFPVLISVMSVPELRGIDEVEGGWRIGASTPLSDVETWADAHLVPLARMLRFFGSRQIKNRGTLGGNLVNASPIGDTAPVLMMLDATLVLSARGSERRVAIGDFFEGYRQTALEQGEVLTAVEIPRPPQGARLGAYKVSKRREMDISAVAAAFRVQTDAAGTVTTARLVYGGMAATTARAPSAEAALLGQPWTREAAQRAAAAIAQDFQPLSDHRGSAWYRATVARNLLLGFFEETQASPVVRLPDAPGGTVVVPEVSP